MTSHQIRQTFLAFFAQKQHQIVPSAPMVIKNDPTLMFTNAGMNQFKDIFIGGAQPSAKRIANTQKCLRVSGKHNDLDEVGHDTYHHTMFEMLGNWSFGDYFKAEAIQWAWELLTERLGIAADRLYATIFEGDSESGIAKDEEAHALWEKFLPQSRILLGNKKDNFWEMGDTGPCGPCSEVHIDLRPDAERKKMDGRLLVNASSPDVIEIWNLVFIQFNRKQNGGLELLPQKHVDTGMGFERLCMTLQGKRSNYDTDVFSPIIDEICSLCGKKYGDQQPQDIAMRVIADHLRAVCFAIADGQLPSNAKAGYVIRRILRRAVRYGYTFLNFKQPALCRLVSGFASQMGDAFPELMAQKNLIENVIREEEASFLRTLEVGIKLLEAKMVELSPAKEEVVLPKEEILLLKSEVALPKNEIEPNKNKFLLPKEKLGLNKMEIGHNKSNNVILNKSNFVLRKYKEHVPKEETQLMNEKDEENKLEIGVQKEKPAHQEMEADVFKYEHEPKMFEGGLNKMAAQPKIIDGNTAFMLYDTYGFPYDLTLLMAREQGFEVDETGFLILLNEQKERSRNAAAAEIDDWQQVNSTNSLAFCGYDTLNSITRIVKYRKVCAKNKTLYHIVLENTPFYGESGGQIGDSGTINIDGDEISIVSAQKENGVIIHIAEHLPSNIDGDVIAKVDEHRRRLIANHHTATHLLHYALRTILGAHVEQKGSMVSADGLRFDFSHFQKVSSDELRRSEMLINAMIRENIPLIERRNIPIVEARALGAMALFGEKYGENVRVVQYAKSVELCAGTHAAASGQIGFFKIMSEGAVSAGVRRVEAAAGEVAEHILYEMQDALGKIKSLFNSNDIASAVRKVIDENADLKRHVEIFMKEKISVLRDKLWQQSEVKNGIRYVEFVKSDISMEMLKELAFQLRALGSDTAFIGGSVRDGKPLLVVMLGDELVKNGLDAAKIVRLAAKHIGGSGGGQAFLATAGGKDANGLAQAVNCAKSKIFG